MTIVIIATLMLIASAACAAFVYLKYQRAAHPSSFKKRRPLTSSEQTLYWRLTKMLPEHVILVQMPVTRCISIKGPAVEKLRQEKLDFVICNQSMQIVAAIDLSSKNEGTPLHQQRNELLSDAFNAAGILLMRWSAKPIPTEAYIAMEIKRYALSQTQLAA